MATRTLTCPSCGAQQAVDEQQLSVGAPCAQCGKPLATGSITPIGAMEKPGFGWAVASLVLGILSLPGFCCYGGLWMGIPAVIFGIIALSKNGGVPGRPGRGMASVGIITGAIGILLSIAMILFGAIFGQSLLEWLQVPTQT